MADTQISSVVMMSNASIAPVAQVAGSDAGKSGASDRRASSSSAPNPAGASGKTSTSLSATAQAAAAAAAKKAPPPTEANAMQMVYVFDDQLHRNVVKLVNIETQKVPPDAPGAAKADGTADGDAAATGDGTDGAGASGTRINTRA